MVLPLKSWKHSHHLDCKIVGLQSRLKLLGSFVCLMEGSVPDGVRSRRQVLVLDKKS